jgi:hypothetical protein
MVSFGTPWFGSDCFYCPIKRGLEMKSRFVFALAFLLPFLYYCSSNMSEVAITPETLDLGVIYGKELQSFPFTIANNSNRNLNVHKISFSKPGIKLSNCAPGDVLVAHATRSIYVNLDPAFTKESIENTIDISLDPKNKKKKTFSFWYCGVPRIKPIPVKLAMFCDNDEEISQSLALDNVNYDRIDKL